MKASELRIGNYINVTRSHGLGENKTYVKQVNLHYLSQLENKSKTITAIQITEDWLIDLGFEQSDNDFFELKLTKLITLNTIDLCLWARSEKGLIITLGTSQGDEPQQTDTELNHITYVHELQNLYFALTKKELEINKK